MPIPLLAIVIAAGADAVYRIRRSNSGSAKGTVLAACFAALAVAVAVISLVARRGDEPELVESLNRYSYAAGHVVGRHLAESGRGSRVLLLVESTWPGEDPDVLQVGIEAGLRQGMGSDLELVDVVPVAPPPGYIQHVRESLAASKVPLPPGMPEGWIPALERDLSRWFSSKYLVSLLAPYEGSCDVLVSAVGLPNDFARGGAREGSAIPETVVVLNPGAIPMARLVAGGAVDALVVMKPSANPWEDANAAPADIGEAFNKRFLLVTADNVREMAGAYPQSPNLR